jgi:4-amino-4-deoxy-L-arabinose transferase-like glycosyltransferase
VSVERSTAARRAFVAILVAAALLRVVFSGWVVGFGAMTKGDEADYHAIATQFASGNGFSNPDGTPTARRPPAYPTFLAALYVVFGPDPVAGRIAQVILGVIIVALTASIARRLFDEKVALVAAAFAALNPFLAFISGYLLTENLYLVLLLSALRLAPDPRRAAGVPLRRACAVAALLAGATLTRPTGMPVFEWILAATLLFGAAAWRARLLRVLAMAAVFTIVVMPWHARNRAVMGGWVLTTHGGITFYQGNNHKVADIPSWRGGVAPLESLPRFDELASMGEVARDRMAWQMGREYLRYQWREIPGLVKWKLIRFWRLRSDMGLSGIRSGWWWSKESALGRLAANVDVGFVYALVAIPLFVAGLWFTRRRWRELLFLYGLVIVHTTVAVVFFGSLRSRLPVEPVICIFAAAATMAAVTAIRRLR